MNNRKLILSGTLVTAFLALIISCDKKVGKPPVALPPASVGFCDTITYNKHIKKIFDLNCVSCHNAGNLSGSTSLTNYIEVKAKADEGRIKARVLDEDPSRMPASPNDPLSAADKQLIRCWLENGKKE